MAVGLALEPVDLHPVGFLAALTAVGHCLAATAVPHIDVGMIWLRPRPQAVAARGTRSWPPGDDYERLVEERDQVPRREGFRRMQRSAAAQGVSSACAAAADFDAWIWCHGDDSVERLVSRCNCVAIGGGKVII